MLREWFRRGAEQLADQATADLPDTDPAGGQDWRAKQERELREAWRRTNLLRTELDVKRRQQQGG